MTSLRSPDLQTYLTPAEAALHPELGVDGPERVAAERMFSALQTPSLQAERPGTARLPVCHHLLTALEHARRQPGPVSP